MPQPKIAWDYLTDLQKAQLQFLRPDITRKGTFCELINRTCTEGDCSRCSKGEKL